MIFSNGVFATGLGLVSITKKKKKKKKTKPRQTLVEIISAVLTRPVSTIGVCTVLFWRSAESPTLKLSTREHTSADEGVRLE